MLQNTDDTYISRSLKPCQLVSKWTFNKATCLSELLKCKFHLAIIFSLGLTNEFAIKGNYSMLIAEVNINFILIVTTM